MLTEAMGFTPPTLYAAFGCKEALYREALDRYGRRTSTKQPAASDTSVFSMVERFLRNAAREFTRGDQPRGCMISTGSLRCAADQHAAVDAAAAHRAAAFDGFIARIEEAKRIGEVPTHTDAHALARFYAAVAQGMSVQAIDGADAAALDAMVDIALAAWPGRIRE